MFTRILPPRLSGAARLRKHGTLVAAAALIAPGLVVVGAFPAAAVSNTYFVDCSNGDDANGGDAADNAFKSLNKAIEVANGETEAAQIEVAAGQCDVSAGVAAIETSMTIIGAGSELSGGDVTVLQGDGNLDNRAQSPFELDPYAVDADTDVTITGFHIVDAYIGVWLDEYDDDETDEELPAIFGSLTVSKMTFDSLHHAIEVIAAGEPNIDIRDVAASDGHDAAFWLEVIGGHLTLENMESDRSSVAGLGVELDGEAIATITNVDVASSNALSALGISAHGESSVEVSHIRSTDNTGRHGITLIADGSATLIASGIETADNEGIGTDLYASGDGVLNVSGLDSQRDDVGVAIDARSSEQTQLCDANIEDSADVGIFAAVGSSSFSGSPGNLLIDSSHVVGALDGYVTVVSADSEFTLRNSSASNVTHAGLFLPTDIDDQHASGVVLIEDSSFYDNGTGIDLSSITEGDLEVVIARSTIANNDEFGLFSDVTSGDSTDDEIDISLINSTISGNGLAQVLVFGDEAHSPIEIAHSTLRSNDEDGEVLIFFQGTGSEITHTILDNADGQRVILDEDFDDNTVEYSLLHTVTENAWTQQLIEAGAGNLVEVDPQLGALGDNGGPTLTHMPDEDSPVVDAGLEASDLPNAPQTDQRGEPRFSSPADIGSVELVKPSEEPEDPEGPEDPEDPEAPEDPEDPGEPTDPTKPDEGEPSDPEAGEPGAGSGEAAKELPRTGADTTPLLIGLGLIFGGAALILIQRIKLN